MSFADSRIREIDVAAVLATIAAPPNARSRARSGDLVGDYDQWFDGGALRVGTGVTTFIFASGVQALVAAAMPRLSVVIRFPDGRTVHVEQR